MTIFFLVLLTFALLYLALRLHNLEHAVIALAKVVDKPRRRDRAIRKEIRELEEELEQIGDMARRGLIGTDDMNRADDIRERLDRRLRALAGHPKSPSARQHS
jgi:hypothetical protein